MASGTSRAPEPFADWEFWAVIRKATNEPIFGEPVRTKKEAQLIARASLRMAMKVDHKELEVRYTMRSDAEVDALVARDYVFRRYKLVETKK